VKEEDGGRIAAGDRGEKLIVEAAAGGTPSLDGVPPAVICSDYPDILTACQNFKVDEREYASAL
jgi:hypothetical protein